MPTFFVGNKRNLQSSPAVTKNYERISGYKKYVPRQGGVLFVLEAISVSVAALACYSGSGRMSCRSGVASAARIVSVAASAARIAVVAASAAVVASCITAVVTSTS